MTTLPKNKVSFGSTLLRLLAATFVAVGAVACFNEEKLIIVGERRDPSNDCARSLVEYEFKIYRDPVTLDHKRDWCAIMEGGVEVTCFLNANNPRKNPYLELPQTLPHSTAEPSHPDWKCWEKELDEWDDAYSGGGAGGSSNN
jgi:hypothetical protein